MAITLITNILANYLFYNQFKISFIILKKLVLIITFLKTLPIQLNKTY